MNASSQKNDYLESRLREPTYKEAKPTRVVETERARPPVACGVHIEFSDKS
jgi:hypothetical protein